MRIVLIVAICFTYIVGCVQSESEQSSPSPQERAPEKKTFNYPVHQVEGLINGREISVDRAQLNHGTFTLLQGDDFFADREVKIFNFSDGNFSDREFIIEPEMEKRPRLQLSWRDEGQSLPTTKFVTGDFALSSRFGKAESLGVPYAIVLDAERVATTKLSGSGYATYKDISVVNGSLDRSYDSFDTLRLIAREYLEVEQGNAIADELDDFHVTYSSSNVPYPHVGYIGIEYQDADGKPLMSRLQLRKDAEGWKVARELKATELNLAHPINLTPENKGGSKVNGQPETVAARFVENKYNALGMVPHIRKTRMSCNYSREYGNCRFSFILKKPAGKECHTVNMLLRHKVSWRVDRELEKNQRIDLQTGEVKKDDRAAPGICRSWLAE